MNRAIVGLVFLIGVVFAEVVLAGPLEEGTAAYSRSDYPTAFRIWSGLADQGDATAQVWLGLMYARGHGVPRDDAEAVRWYRKAAEQGFAWGQTNLGYMYTQGRGIAKDDAEAVQWFLKAAGQDFAMAQDNLGVMYRDGHGVTQNPAMAVDWFRKSAEHGYAQGQNHLGLMYRAGRGIAKDDAQAVEWFRKAAEQGDALGQLNLGVMYRAGRGIAKDDAEAERWLRRAAAQGDLRAQSLLSSTTRRPTKMSGSEPEFPPDAIAAGIERGRVVAQVLIDETGNVYEVTILKADPPGHFDQAVIQALSQWTFLGDGTKRKTEIETKFELNDGLARSPGELKSTIAALVKKYEGAQSAAFPPDAERAALAHEVIQVSLARDKWSNETLSQEMDDPRKSTNLSPQLVDAMRAAVQASFQPDAILASWERKLAETMDAATLQVGLQWERSDLGRHINRLEAEAKKPDQHAAYVESVRQLVSKGGTVNDARTRACAQVDILANQTDALLPVFEAISAVGVMALGAQQGQQVDKAAIEHAVVTARPLFRETARQVVLAGCLFELRELTDGEFEQWLAFLRSEAGGRYARGASAALRDALLARAEPFTRVMLEVARILRARGEA